MFLFARVHTSSKWLKKDQCLKSGFLFQSLFSNPSLNSWEFNLTNKLFYENALAVVKGFESVKQYVGNPDHMQLSDKQANVVASATCTHQIFHTSNLVLACRFEFASRKTGRYP